MNNVSHLADAALRALENAEARLLVEKTPDAWMAVKRARNNFYGVCGLKAKAR